MAHPEQGRPRLSLSRVAEVSIADAVRGRHDGLLRVGRRYPRRLLASRCRHGRIGAVAGVHRDACADNGTILNQI